MNNIVRSNSTNSNNNNGFKWDDKLNLKKTTSKEKLYAFEFKHPIKHCENKECNLQDFLPISCTLCNKNYCNNCYKYENHQCNKIKNYENQYQIPKCYACKKNVPFLDSNRNANDTIDFHLRFHCKKTEIGRNSLISPDNNSMNNMINSPLPNQSKSTKNLRKSSSSSTTENESSEDTAINYEKNYNYQLKKPKIYKNKCSKKFCKKKSAHNFKCIDCKKTFCVSHRFEKDHDCTGKIDLMKKELKMKMLNNISNTTILPIISAY